MCTKNDQEELLDLKILAYLKKLGVEGRIVKYYRRRKSGRPSAGL